jgi:hypothetical protein
MLAKSNLQMNGNYTNSSKIFCFALLTEFVLCLVVQVEKIVFRVAADVFGVNESFTMATCEANKLGITISATYSSIVRRYIDHR